MGHAGATSWGHAARVVVKGVMGGPTGSGLGEHTHTHTCINAYSLLLLGRVQ